MSDKVVLFYLFFEDVLRKRQKDLSEYFYENGIHIYILLYDDDRNLFVEKVIISNSVTRYITLH
jgi:hypothetical protein